jgi:peptidoglycan/LPS O-acetylase OafA/YrhL
VSAGPGRRNLGIDALRGVAVALVMLRHALPAPFAGAGLVGVVMFFALSGFLITGVLVEELERTGRLDLRRFYLRRARRLVPALLVLVTGVVLVTLALDPIGDRARLGHTVLVALTWTANLPFAHPSQATFHLWTLATEEQFYLLWPGVLAAAYASNRVGSRLLAVGAACLAACLASTWWARADPDLAYALPTSWAGCFAIGAAARWYAGRLPVTRRAALLAVALLAVLSVVPLRGHASTYLLGGPAIAALTAVALLAAHRTGGADLAIGRTGRALVWLGTVSYAAYLWNYPLTIWLRPHLGDGAGLLAAALTLVAAALSTHLVEAPLQRRWQQPRARPVEVLA